MNSQNWVKSNCKFAALSPTEQARSEVVGTAYAVIGQYHNYKSLQSPSNDDLMDLFRALDILAKNVEKAKATTQPVVQTNVEPSQS